MKKLPFCKECKYYIKKGVCALADKPYEHIYGEHWCLKGEFKGKSEKGGTE